MASADRVRLVGPAILHPVSGLAFFWLIGDEMKGKRSTEEQIIGILNEAEQAENTREVCRLNNILEQTFHRWRSDGAEPNTSKRSTA